MHPTESHGFIESFFSAFRGIKHVLRERNFVVQLTIAVLVLALAEAIGLAPGDEVLLVILIAFVLASEAINSACERMLDLFTREHNAEVARIKEILASAVLIYSMTAIIAGLWIFARALAMR